MLFCEKCRGLLTRRTVNGEVAHVCPKCSGGARRGASRGSGGGRSGGGGKPWWVVDDGGAGQAAAGARAQSGLGSFGGGGGGAPARGGPRGRSRADDPANPKPAQERRPPREIPPPDEVRVPSDARFFPHDRIRDGQRDFVADVADAARNGQVLVANAPTGLGKTASSLAPLVEYALRHKKRVFFLTSKQSQHKIAVDTLKRIRDRAGVPITVSDIIGKQDMCPRREAREMFSKRFAEFCRRQQVHHECDFFETPNGPAIKILKREVHHVEESIIKSTDCNVCPHQAALDLAAQAHVVVCDYNYFFSDMREGIEERLRVNLSDVLLVVDEAHNLPDRIRAHLSLELNDFVLDDAMDELKDLGDEGVRRLLDVLRDVVAALAEEDPDDDPDLDPMSRAALADDRRRGPGRDGERGITRDRFIARVNDALGKNKAFLAEADYESLVSDLSLAEDAYEKRFKDAPRGLALLKDFLVNWKRERQGLARYATTEPYPTLHYQMLDPSLLARGVFESVHCAVIMSGTLHPGEMYRDVLGLPKDRTVLRAYPSPFPPENRLLLVDGGVTTSYKERGSEMYRRIAANLAGVAEATPGNVAAFFPSYALLESVRLYLPEFLQRKDLIVEERQFSKAEKEGLVGRMREDATGNALLCGVQGGSLSEGYDYEDNLLKGVVIVGLPFAAPSIDVQALIDYYDRKFTKRNGRNYAYVYPTMNRVLQAAGRCIRSPTDRGVIILMDHRFNWSSYRATYPPGFEPRPSRDPVADVRRFWGTR